MSGTIPYCGPAPAPDAVLSAWNFDPVLLAGLVLLGWILRGAGPGVKAGLAVVAIAWISPLCALSAGLFAARSIHHILVVFVAAPLLAPALRGGGVSLAAALAGHVAVFWLWHLPAAYELALSSDGAYWAGQFALLGSALLLWQALERDGTPPTAVFFAIAAMVMQMGMLGALLTFAPRALYAPHYFTTARYGIGVLADQQLSGLLMWVGSLPVTAFAAWKPLARLARLAGARRAQAPG